MSSLAFNAAPFDEDNNESNIEKKRNARAQIRVLKIEPSTLNLT